ncbi:myosin heavy chain, striated muscle isoform X2 [Anopheles gambiae]|uniref:NF-kappa-B essential modulator NEMO CC2-LZ domain-containing protein n=1 Tax=Anopheles coluzzii TaxID=1518534 RepID=A0A6E8UY08_ANOCL|nr:myosin heavy chain, striated muscle-like isoform X2 [Anopheles coluzzii]XP_061513638.1 myosin heavy chain, striated muscle isoform X2 [Anopheles gambiae]
MAETMATSTDDTNVESTRTQCDCSQQQLIEARAQLTALEQSNETLQKKLDGYRKDNENLVIKYAFVEKKVLDLKALVGDKDSQLKRHEQEVASLQKQIGTLKADKAKLQKNIESKLLQHVIAEETHQASEQVAEMERKVMELQAREIMLKHANDEQAGRIGTLQRANHELRDTIERQEKKHTSTLQTLKELETERDHLRQQMGQLQESFHQQQAAIAELQSKVEAASVAAQESSRMERAVAEQRAELEQLAGTLDEQRKDLEVLAARELELLALNKDLSEVNCLLQQEIATQESKTIAITLEYGKFVSMCQEYDAQIVSLANSLAAERQHRTEERLLMAKHIADRTRKLEQAESCLQQTLNELEANRKKYFALVKDFKREMKNAHCGVESSMVGQ